MLEIKNTEVYGLRESMIRSGYPMRTDVPDMIYDTQKDIKRAKKLANTPNGSGHDNFLKGIIVQFDLKYPQYFTPQLQRYHFVDIISSQSKMHKLTSVSDIGEHCNKYVEPEIINIVNTHILDYNEKPNNEKFMRIISNLPMGYEMWMGISTNYLQLKTIYQQRKNHKLECWQYFCDWIETLPYSYLITGKK